LPEPPCPGVVPVDAGEQTARAPVEALFAVSFTGGTEAPALQPRNDKQEVYRGVACFRVVELVIQIAGDREACDGVGQHSLVWVHLAQVRLVLREHQLDVPPWIGRCRGEVGPHLFECGDWYGDDVEVAWPRLVEFVDYRGIGLVGR